MKNSKVGDPEWFTHRDGKTGIFQNDLCKAVTFSLHKKGGTSSSDSYSGMLLLNALKIIFIKIRNNRLVVK